jgi:hypothetical protein
MAQAGPRSRALASEVTLRFDLMWMGMARKLPAWKMPVSKEPALLALVTMGPGSELT